MPCCNSPMLKELGLRIRDSRIKAGLSQIDLARLCGWESQSRISGYERGLREPKQADLELLAKALGTDVAWIAFGRESDDSNNNVREAQTVYERPRSAPVISWVQAGGWREAIDIHPPGNGDSTRAVPTGTGDKAFWLKVVGDSMTNPHGQPSIPEGALILVDPDISPTSGKLVVARLQSTNDVTFKKLIADAGRRWLKPLNPDYPMLEINGNCEIIGVVRKMEIDL